MGDKSALLAGNKSCRLYAQYVGLLRQKAPLIQQHTLSHTTNVVFSLPEYLKGKDMTCTLTSCIQTYH